MMSSFVHAYSQRKARDAFNRLVKFGLPERMDRTNRSCGVTHR
jgi:hypothetical protein